MRFTVGLLVVAMGAFAVASPLYDYVHTDDHMFKWHDTGIRYNNATTDPTWTGYLLNVTTQRWLNESIMDRPVWTHQLVVIVPTVIKDNKHAGLYITGGDNTDGPPKNDSEDVLLSVILALESGIVTATLFQVPNQPIVFPADPLHKERSEDALVAYTWAQYIKNPTDPNILVYFAMAKAGVKALDTLEQFAPTVNSNLQIDSFFVHGASKRGWTTWAVAATDSRVKGFAPIVFDALNFTAVVDHMYRALGGWTFAFTDYWNQNITQDLADPAVMATLSAQVDPLVYKENMTVPKMIVDATGDEFFMPDDDYYWWGELPGETYRLMAPNAEHSFATGIPLLVPALSAFYQAILSNTPRPVFDWSIDPTDGTINIVADQQPSRVTMFVATTIGGERRDFRLIKGDTPHDPCKFIPVHVFGTACINPVLWVGEDVKGTQVDNKYHYALSQPLPPTGWRGFLGIIRFPSPTGKEFIFTTQVSIIPNVLPFPQCQTAAECKGFLV